MSVIGLPIGATADGGTFIGEGPPSVASPFDLMASDPTLVPIYLFVGAPYDPDTSALTNIYYSTAPFTSDVTDTPSAQVFTENRISVPIDLSNDLTLQRGQLIATGSTASDIVLSTEKEGDRIDEVATYLWDGRSAKVLVGFDGYKLSECAEIINGTAEGSAWDRDQIRIRMRSPRLRMERDIQTELYGGVGNGLSLSYTMTGAGDAYLYSDLTAVTDYVIQTGDVLEYSVYWPSGTVSLIGFDFTTSDATTLRSSGAVDQNGLSSDPATDISAKTAGSWYKRTISIPAALVGKTITKFDLACEYNSTGTVTGRIGDIKITDGAGTTNKSILSTAATAAPSVTTDTTSGGNSVTLTLIVEGGSEIAEKTKPLIYGQRRQVEGILVDSANLVYDLHDGSAQAIGPARDRGIDLTLDADYATYQALLAATVGSSEYATCKALGKGRLGASPSGVVTWDVQGDNSGPLGYVTTAPDIVRTIAATRGDFANPSEFDVGSLDDLSDAQPAVIGISTGLEARTIADVCDEVAGSIGAFVDFTRAGRLKLTRLIDPTTATAIATVTDVEPTTFRGQVADIPAHVIRLGYRLYPKTLSGQESASSLPDATRLDYAQSYRFASDANPSVLTLHPSAATYVVPTNLDDPDVAAAEATRLLALYSPTRHVLEVDAWNSLYRFELGDIITLQVARYDLTPGKNFVVIGIRESPVTGDAHENIAHLVLWGREN